MTARTLNGGSFNCREGRPAAVVKANLAQIIADHAPDFLCLQETNGYVPQLSTTPRHRLVIHDKCGTALLVRDGVEAKFAAVLPMGLLPWPFRVNPRRPVTMHPRRAAVHATLDGWFTPLSVHAVPNPDGNLVRRLAYEDGMRRLTRWAANAVKSNAGRAYAFIGDFNRTASDPRPYTPTWLAAQISSPGHPGRVEHVPGHIDLVVSRGCTVTNIRAAGNYGSDHELILFTVHHN